MASKNHKSTSGIKDIPELLKVANNCINVARRNHKPLNGNNNYAHNFLELRAKSIHISKELHQKLRNTDDNDVKNAVEEITNQLKTYFNPDTANRPETQKGILFTYKSIIEPALVDSPEYEPIGELFPLEIIAETRDYIIDIGKQANGCFEKGWYDASAVMVRRLLETLIIECYEKYKISDLIKGRDGNFLFLKDLIDHFINETSWNLSRNTKTALPKLKEVGDLSAHSRRYVAKKLDITNIRQEIRIVIEELVHIADFNNNVKP